MASPNMTIRALTVHKSSIKPEFNFTDNTVCTDQRHLREPPAAAYVVQLQQAKEIMVHRNSSAQQGNSMRLRDQQHDRRTDKHTTISVDISATSQIYTFDCGALDWCHQPHTSVYRRRCLRRPDDPYQSEVFLASGWLDGALRRQRVKKVDRS